MQKEGGCNAVPLSSFISIISSIGKTKIVSVKVFIYNRMIHRYTNPCGSTAHSSGTGSFSLNVIDYQRKHFYSIALQVIEEGIYKVGVGVTLAAGVMEVEEKLI